MKILNWKKEQRLVEQVETEGLKINPMSVLRSRFRKNRLAVWSLRILYGLVFLAVFGDFIANEKPLYCKIDGKIWFPVFRQYAVDLGLAKWEAQFFQKDWREHDFEQVIFPLIPYSGHTIDPKNNNYRSPFGKQQVTSLRYRHWLGTDKLGHDLLAGLISGTRVALMVGLIAMSIAAAIGISLGALAGYFGDRGVRITHLRLWINLVAAFFAWFYGFQARSFTLSETAKSGGLGWELLVSLAIVAAIFFIANGLVFLLKKISLLARARVTLPLDLLVMRIVEVMNSIPGFLLLLALAAILQKSSVFYVMVIIGLIRWTGIARFLRAELLKVRQMGYVEAARAMGFSHARILFRHALPNALGPVLITLAFGIASAVLLESTLSFLGIGVGEDRMTWGKLLSEARRYPGAWWLAVFPGGAIFLTVTIFNLIGEGLLEAMSSR